MKFNTSHAKKKFHMDFNKVLTNVNTTHNKFLPKNCYFVSNHAATYGSALVTFGHFFMVYNDQSHDSRYGDTTPMMAYPSYLDFLCETMIFGRYHKNVKIL